MGRGGELNTWNILLRSSHIKKKVLWAPIIYLVVISVFITALNIIIFFVSEETIEVNGRIVKAVDDQGKIYPHYISPTHFMSRPIVKCLIFVFILWATVARLIGYFYLARYYLKSNILNSYTSNASGTVHAFDSYVADESSIKNKYEGLCEDVASRLPDAIFQLWMIFTYGGFLVLMFLIPEIIN